YLASLSFADDMLGELLDALDHGPMAGDTLIVFWGDHGYHLGEKENWEKFALWEDTTHVPLIIVDPRRTKPGTRCESPVSLLDLYPTLVELCGLGSPPQLLEGRSLAQHLAEPNAKTRHVAVTTQGKGNHAVRSGRYRYIHYADGGEELYDHKADPHEWSNLAGTIALAKVKLRLAKHLPVVNAQPISAKRKQ
ncbi:MAG TPA: sulfatase-like hydrolase/transferase, partial [Verrucomicrobiota bacterium]|nr:sulfatase-like hydrolase/transferase [Verrucomicrobiota bacterium]